MPKKSLTDVLGQFDQDSHTVKLCGALLGVIPGAPPFVFYNNIEGAVARMAGGDAAVLKAACDMAKSDDMCTALWVTNTIDTLDAAIGVYTSVRNLANLLWGEKGEKRTFEADTQQATDAVIKAFGLAYMIHRIYPGSVTEKVKLFRQTPAGQELTIYYAVAEIALPFTDNLVEGGTNLVSRLIKSRKAEAAAKLPATGDTDAVKNATAVLDELSTPLGECVEQTKDRTRTVSERIKAYLPSGPTVANVADSTTGALATAVDMMPVWRFLGGRVVAEACVLRAMKGI